MKELPQKMGHFLFWPWCEWILAENDLQLG